jgi:hypothetical protein
MNPHTFGHDRRWRAAAAATRGPIGPTRAATVSAAEAPPRAIDTAGDPI